VKRILLWVVPALMVVAALVFMSRPQPLEVETAALRPGTIESFVTEEAETRLDDEYSVAMPVGGRLFRIDAKVGTMVKKGDVIARIDPFERREKRKLLAARVREIEAMIVGVDKAKPKPEDIKTAELTVEQARLRLDAAKKALEVARINFEQEKKQYLRRKELVREGSISQARFDEAERSYLTLKSRHDEAVLNHGAGARAWEETQVRLKRLRDSIDDNEYQRTAYLAQIEQTQSRIAVLADELEKTEIRAPVSGPILEKYQEDTRVLPAGTPLIKIGDMESIRVEADVLSEEVGQVKVGQEARIFGLAIGPEPLVGKVERIHPAGFQKISSLGIEQQRVKVIFAFDNSDLQLRPGVRVDVSVVTGRRENVLLMPERALFKQEGSWRAFLVREGRAVITAVEVGMRNDDFAEVGKGASAGDTVILGPPAELADGAAVVSTEKGGAGSP